MKRLLAKKCVEVIKRIVEATEESIFYKQMELETRLSYLGVKLNAGDVDEVLVIERAGTPRRWRGKGNE